MSVFGGQKQIMQPRDSNRSWEISCSFLSQPEESIAFVRRPCLAICSDPGGSLPYLLEVLFCVQSNRKGFQARGETLCTATEIRVYSIRFKHWSHPTPPSQGVSYGKPASVDLLVYLQSWPFFKKTGLCCCLGFTESSFHPPLNASIAQYLTPEVVKCWSTDVCMNI